MATREIQRPTPSGEVPRVVRDASPGEDAVTALLSACLVGGALTDAWAHTNIIDELESFFTPWHALFYSGFAATAGWIFFLAYRRRGGSPTWWRDCWPAGYGLGALGVLVFLFAGVGDMVWHSIFGIENGLDAGLSPTHLLIVTAGTLMVTSPMRSWWARGSDRRWAPSGVASLALGTVFATTLLGNLLALMSVEATRPYDHVYLSPSHQEVSFGLGKYLISTVILLVPVLLAHRRRAAFGTATAVVGSVSLFVLVMHEFPMPQAVAAAAATAAAVLVDLLVVRLDAVRGPEARLRLPIAGALFAALVWSGQLIGLQVAEGIGWTVELWTGTIVLSAVLGALLGGLASRPYPYLASPEVASPEVASPEVASPEVARPEVRSAR